MLVGLGMTNAILALGFALLAFLGCGPASTPSLLSPVPDGGGPVVRRMPDPDAGPGTDARGSIAGQVTLFGAASSAGVRVDLEPLGLVTLSTDSSGDFLFEAVPPGAFTLTFSAPGYASVTLSDVLAPGDAAFETVQLQRSVAVGLLDGGTISWMGGPPNPDAGGPLYALDDLGNLYTLDPVGRQMTLNYSSDAGLASLGISASGVGFFSVGSGTTAAVGIASSGGFSLVGVPEMIRESAILSGERLFFATQPMDGGWLRSWASLVAGDLWPLPELDAVLVSPPPVLFDQGLAGYRQQDPGCAQLMAFGAGVFTTLADCLALEPMQLDSSLDGRLVTAVRQSGSPTVDFFDILGSDGGISSLDVGIPKAYSHAVPLDPETLYLIDVFGEISVWSAPDKLRYAAPALGIELRPGGSFLAAVVSDGGETELVTNDGHTTLPFGAPWSTPDFSPDGRYALFRGFPTLFDLQVGAEYALVVNPIVATFSPLSEGVLIVGVDGSLAVVHLPDLPPPSSPDGTAGPDPAGELLEGTAVTAAAFTPDGSGIVYAGTDPIGRAGVFLITPPW